MGERIALTRHNAESAREIRAILVDIYRDGSTSAELNDPFLRPEAFDKRLDLHLARSGYRLVTASRDDQLMGFIYGYPLPTDTRWFDSMNPPIHHQHLDVVSAGRMLAINELMVRPHCRRQGVATGLHDEYLRDQAAEYVTLLVEAENESAVNAYTGWGYERIGEITPDPDHPFVAMLRAVN